MNTVIEQLQINKGVYNALLKTQPEAIYLWKKDPESWCLLEILCHLYDEERDDFRFRIHWALSKPDELPPSIDPIAWVKDHKYMEQEYANMLVKFIEERERSLTWLRSLKDVNWDNSFEHPKLGRLSAHYLLNNWLAHDYLHIKQIIRLKYDYLEQHSGDTLSYAGTWN
ncbi:DinB family protein [Flavobacteriaceae bacterium MAR_2010_105]|nr:DinB family protein [Flavobacteriaceae bacterium MAR_2010_105]